VPAFKAEAVAVPAPAASSAPIALASGSATALLEEPVSETSNNGSTDIEGIWAQLIEAVGRVSPFMKTYLLESHPVGMNKSTFTIGFDPEFKDHLSLVDTAKNRTILETKIREMGHRDMAIRFVQAEAPANRVRVSAPIETPPEIEFTAPTPRTSGSNGANGHAPVAATAQAAAPKFSKEDFKNDPLIKKALEIFKGTIVEVRA
jgi:hypothetical protein